MGTELLAITAGIILHANPEWFDGAYTVGTVCLVYGIVVLALEILFFVGAAVLAFFGFRD